MKSHPFKLSVAIVSSSIDKIISMKDYPLANMVGFHVSYELLQFCFLLLYKLIFYIYVYGGGNATKVPHLLDKRMIIYISDDNYLFLYMISLR